MNTVFACTYVTKTAERDEYEKGSVGKATCIISESCSVTADTLPDLLKKLEQRYTFQPINDLFIPGDDDEDIGFIGWNQLEDEYGNQPTEPQIERWKAGKLNLYLCDYSFRVEVRQVRPLRITDIEAAEVTTH